MTKITIVAFDGTRFDINAENGSTVMENAIRSSVPGIEAECGGACACATCHVYVDEAWTEKVGAPEAMEEAYADPDKGVILKADRFISSGLLAAAYLEKQVPYGKVAYLGKPESAHYIEIAGQIPVPIGEARLDDHLVAIVLLDDEGFDWFRDVNGALNLIRRANVPVIVANADITYPVRGNDIAIAVGSLGGLLSQITEKTFIRFGKPDSMMFAYAFARALELNPKVSKRDVLFVGDTLRTDIIGANTFGFDTALMLSGNTLPAQAELMIESSGIIPSYICHSIVT